MNLTRWSLKNPSAIAVFVLAVLSFGVFSYLKMPLNLMPNIEFPIVTVVTSMPGASSTQIEEQVSSEITKRLSTISGVTEMTASSVDSASIVAVSFDYGVSLDEASDLIEDKLVGIDTVLPNEANLPAVSKVDIATMPAVSIAISSPRELSELTEMVNDIVLPKLSKVEGVASTGSVGGQKKEVVIALDPDKAAKSGISSEMLAGIIMGYNKSIPLGQTTYKKEKISLRSENVLESVEDLKNMTIMQMTGEKIKLSDVCDIDIQTAPQASVSRYNGNANVDVSVYKKSGANTLSVVADVKAEIDNLNNDNSGFKINVINDESKFILLSVNNVWSNLIVGGILAIFILILFLRSVKSALIVGSAIPLSIVAAICMMYAFGVPFNMVSIGGMAIGVGMVVDNAIVVSESIYRYRSDGFTPKKAAFLGCKLVSGAIAASTITTVAVFFPIMFSQGLTKEIFTHLSLTIIFSLVASLVIAITVIPVLSVPIGGANKHRSKLFTKIDQGMGKFFDALERGYGKFVGVITNKKLLVIILSVVLFGSSLMLIPLIGTEFLPSTDQGQINIVVEVEGAKTLEDSGEKVDEIEKVLRQTPEIEKILTTIGNMQSSYQSTTDPSIVNVSCFLSASADRDRGLAEVSQELRDNLAGVEGATFKVAEVSSLIDGMFSGAGGMSAPVSINVTADSQDTLNDVNQKIFDVVKDTEGVINTTSSIGKQSQEIVVTVSPQKALDYGLTSMQVSGMIRNAVAGIDAGVYVEDGKNYDMIIRYKEEFVHSINKIKKMQIPTPAGVPVQLSDIADVEVLYSPNTITKEGTQYKATVSAFVVGRDSGSVNKDILSSIDTLGLPKDVVITAGGEQSLMDESLSGLITALIFSICLVYVVLAIQFNSFKNPFIIMMSLPFAFSGSFLLLLAMKYTLNMTSMIGMIILVGIVVNNAIVLIDRINSLRLEGKPIQRAIVLAGQTRLRPILMTALTTILGLVPVALASGDGAEIMAPMAVAVIGGMITSTLLTLIIIPVLYALFNKKELKIDASDDI